MLSVLWIVGVTNAINLVDEGVNGSLTLALDDVTTDAIVFIKDGVTGDQGLPIFIRVVDELVSAAATLPSKWPVRCRSETG